MQDPSDMPHVRFAVVGDRRNGIDRLSLFGTLDDATIPLLETEVDDVAHAGGAIVLDLHHLETVDGTPSARSRTWAVARGDADGLLFLVNVPEPVRDRSSGTEPATSSARTSPTSSPPATATGSRSRFHPSRASARASSRSGSWRTRRDRLAGAGGAQRDAVPRDQRVDRRRQRDIRACRRIRSSANAATRRVASTITLTHVEYEERARARDLLRDRHRSREPGSGRHGLGAARGSRSSGSCPACRRGSRAHRIPGEPRSTPEGTGKGWGR